MRLTSIKFPALFILSIFVTYLYASTFTMWGFVVYIAVITIASAALVKWGELYSFFTLITVIFVSAFVKIYLAFMNPATSYQIHLLSEQTLGIAMVLLWWILIVYTYREHKRREELEQLLYTLEKIDPVSGVLTMSEFKDEMFYITRALSRRNEPGTLIRITIKGLSDKVPDKVLREVGNIILSSIRLGYDIVGRDGNTFFVLLQGTDTEHAQIVIDRIKKKVLSGKHINGHFIAQNMNIITTSITHDFETNLSLLPVQETI